MAGTDSGVQAKAAGNSDFLDLQPFDLRRSGNFPRGSGNFLWRMGSYPVSEYSELRHWRNVRRGSLDGVMMLLGGFEVLEGVWGVAEAEW